MNSFLGAILVAILATIGTLALVALLSLIGSDKVHDMAVSMGRAAADAEIHSGQNIDREIFILLKDCLFYLKYAETMGSIPHSPLVERLENTLAKIEGGEA